MNISFLYYEAVRAYSPEALKAGYEYTPAHIERFYINRWGTHTAPVNRMAREWESWHKHLRGMADTVMVAITVPDQEVFFEDNIDKLDIRKYVIYRDEECAVNQNYVDQGPRLRTWIFQFPADYKGVDNAKL